MPYLTKTLKLNIPEEYEFIDFRPAYPGEKYINPMDNRDPKVFTWRGKSNPFSCVFVVKNRVMPEKITIHPIDDDEMFKHDEIVLVDLAKNVHRVQVLGYKTYWDCLGTKYISVNTEDFIGWYPLPEYNILKKEK